MNDGKSYIGLYIFISMILECLFFVLLFLRLFGVVAVPFFWIFAPLWLPSSVVSVILIVVMAAISIREKSFKSKKYITISIFQSGKSQKKRFTDR